MCGSKRVRAVKVKKRPLRNATLKDVMRKKKEAKSALWRACKEGLTSESIGVLAKQFFSLVRSHNQLKKASEAQRVSSSARRGSSSVSSGLPEVCQGGSGGWEGEHHHTDLQC